MSAAIATQGGVALAPERVQPSAVSETAALVSMIERAARDPSVDIDKMERLFLMQERAVARNARAAFYAALSAMQPDLPVVGERGRIEVRAKTKDGDRSGPIQQSTSYALWEDINEAVRPALREHGFALSFRTGLTDDGRVSVTGILSHRDGHAEETTMVLQHDTTGSKNAVQAVGSSTSYGKRYTAMALLNITSRADIERDDDGQAAGGPALITAEQVQRLQDLIIEVGADPQKFLAAGKIERLEDLPAADFASAVDLLKRKAARGAK